MTAKQRSRRVCVLGGSGFVGRALVGLLVSSGYDVVVPTRSRTRSRALWVFSGVELLETDVDDEIGLTRLLRGCDAAINLIGILNESAHDGSGFKRAHVELAEKLVRACRASNVPRLIQMSALKANADAGPSHYLKTKGQAEEAVKALCGTQIQFTIFRPSVIFGAEDSFTRRFASLLRLVPVLPLPCADARFAPVFVGDVAHAFLVALENRETHGQTYELCGPDIYSLREVVAFIRWRLRLKRIVLPLPQALGHAQAWVAEYLLPGKPFSLDNFRSLSVASTCSDNGFASLGIKPRSLATIMPTYIGEVRGAQRLARLRQNARR